MADTISILDGSTFVVSDRRGDLDASPDRPEGLFYDDTRFLSRWVLTVNGARPDMLSTDERDYFAAQFFLVPPRGTVLKGEPYARVQDGKLVLGYRRDDFVRETRIDVSAPAEIDERGFTFHIRLEPKATWETCVNAVPVADQVCVIKSGHGATDAKPNIGESLADWLARAPKVESDWDPLEHVYERSLVDLAALRFYPKILSGAALPAAGLPWFMALFGRDSLITSYQALPFAPELAATALRVLAARQGTRYDDFRDEDPGKILHELRFGELTVFGERPHSPYYETADATPLFLVLLDEYERWSGDGALVRELEPNARAALAWLDRSDDGYLWYDRRTPAGLENQCWKDSWDSIRFADGTLAALPRATCELQGYVYDAKLRCARLALEHWDDAELAARLTEEAAALKARFNGDFWLADRGYFALALDGDGGKVDALTSNIGQLLWSGIVDDDKVDAVVAHLLGPRLFSGWGVRTMAEGDGGYNPIGYHVGTVWPHDNSLIALGLARHGYRAEANRIAVAMLEAASYFRYRLPEVFAGYPREATMFPVEYPTASSPQAWATAAPFALLRVFMGMDADDGELRVEPSLPDRVRSLSVTGVPGRWGRADAVATEEVRA